MAPCPRPHVLDVFSQFVQLLVFIHRWQPNLSPHSVLRSCPELDKDSSGQTSIVTGFSDSYQFQQISKLGFPNTMDKTGISRSAHTIKVLVNFNSYFTSIYNDHLLAQARLQIQIWVGLCIFNFTFIESCQSKMRLGFTGHSLLTQFFIHQLLSSGVVGALVGAFVGAFVGGEGVLIVMLSSLQDMKSYKTFR